MARTGNGFEKLDSLNESAKGKKWLDWVAAPPKDHWIWKYYLATGNYNSPDYWKNTKVPVLLVYGEKDQIEDVNNYLQNIEIALTAQAGDKDVTKIILPNAQHNLCIFPEKNEKFFWWHTSPGYEETVAGWILKRFKN
jgi:pimeloyl-ACP methyl ester carboxylesterase